MAYLLLRNALEDDESSGFDGIFEGLNFEDEEDRALY